MINKTAIFIGIVFLGIAIFGMGASMPMDKNGNMPNCPFAPGGSSICPMNALEHIGYWQHLFTSTIPTTTALTLLLALVIITYCISRRKLMSKASLVIQTIRTYKEHDAQLKLFDPLLLLFSDGILNPKIYAFSR